VEKSMQELINWLMTGPAWVQFHCLVDLLDRAGDDSQVKTARAEMLQDPQILQLITDVESWDSELLKRHNDAVHPIHKLVFLADLGLTIQDKKIKAITTTIMQHRSSEGPFQVLSNYPTHFGGSGKDEWVWCMCDAPSILYALQKMGLGENQSVNAALDSLSGLIRQNGWPCAAANELKNFRGPGRQSDPCPYANLIMLKTLINRSKSEDLEAIQIGADAALSLWENSLEIHPYLFQMGNDFRKLKVPFIWYDILHLADVISQCPQFRKDKRFQEIIAILLTKSNSSFRFSSESIWTKWSGWEFCQKREPSRWVTLCVLRILKRTGDWSFS
jgi:hypothetical protein